MKKIFLGLFGLALVISLTGCGNSTTRPSTTATENINFDYDTSHINSPQEIQQEALKIQMNKTMSKQEKAAALKALQKRNKELLDQALSK